MTLTGILFSTLFVLSIKLFANLTDDNNKSFKLFQCDVSHAKIIQHDFKTLMPYLKGGTNDEGGSPFILPYRILECSASSRSKFRSGSRLRLRFASTVQTFNSCTGHPDVCQCQVIQMPVDNMSRNNPSTLINDTRHLRIKALLSYEVI